MKSTDNFCSVWDLTHRSYKARWAHYDNALWRPA